MNTAILDTLATAEKQAVEITQAAEAAYAAAVKAKHSPEELAPLDPGRVQSALGALRLAKHHLETQRDLEAAGTPKTP